MTIILHSKLTGQRVEVVREAQLQPIHRALVLRPFWEVARGDLKAGRGAHHRGSPLLLVRASLEADGVPPRQRPGALSLTNPAPRPTRPEPSRQDSDFPSFTPRGSLQTRASLPSEPIPDALSSPSIHPQAAPPRLLASPPPPEPSPRPGLHLPETLPDIVPVTW